MNIKKKFRNTKNSKGLAAIVSCDVDPIYPIESTVTAQNILRSSTKIKNAVHGCSTVIFAIEITKKDQRRKLYTFMF